MGPILVLIYILLCVILAIMGRKSSLGFWGILFLAAFFTPFLVALFLNISRQIQINKDERRTRKAEKKAAKSA